MARLLSKLWGRKQDDKPKNISSLRSAPEDLPAVPAHLDDQGTFLNCTVHAVAKAITEGKLKIILLSYISKELAFYDALGKCKNKTI